MKTQEELVKYYTNNLAKVKSSWNDGSENSQGYIDYAQTMLDIVIEKGMDGLVKFWEDNKKQEQAIEDKIYIKDEMSVIIKQIFEELKSMLENMDAEELEIFKKENATILDLIVDIKRDTSDTDIREYLNFHNVEPKMISARDIKESEFLDIIYALATGERIMTHSNPTSIVQYKSSRSDTKNNIGLSIVDGSLNSRKEYFLNYFQSRKTLYNFLKSIIRNEGIENPKNAKEHLSLIGVEISKEDIDGVKEMYKMLNTKESKSKVKTAKVVHTGSSVKK